MDPYKLALLLIRLFGIMLVVVGAVWLVVLVSRRWEVSFPGGSGLKKSLKEHSDQ